MDNASLDAIISIGVQIPVVFIFGVFVLQLNRSNRDASAEHHKNWREFIDAQNKATAGVLTMLSGSVDQMAVRLDRQLALFARRDEELVDLIRELRADNTGASRTARAGE